MFNIAQKIQIALGLFTTKAHPIQLAEGIGGAAPAKKARKVGYGESLRNHFAAKRLQALNSKKAQ